MKMRIWRFILPILCLIHFSLLADSSASLVQLERLIATLKIHLGDVLYPDLYSRFQNELERLREANAASSDPTQIDALTNDLQQWTEIAAQTQKALSDVLEARERAINIGAENLSTNTFQNAEKSLQSAAENLQNQRNTRSAQKARDLYQQAEQEAIRDKLLGEVRILLHESAELGAETVAPNQFQKTQQLLRDVENLLSRKNPPFMQLTQKSQQLIENARQLLFLVHQLKPLQHSNIAQETFLTDLQSEFRILAKDLFTTIRFDEDLSAVFKDLRAAIANVQQQNQDLIQRNAELIEENRILTRELAAHLTASARQELLQGKVERMLARFPGKIEQQNGFLSLKMDSVKFNPGSYDLSPQSLSNLNDAVLLLNEFSESPVIVRYVQVSSENLIQVQQLANWRAETICEYLHRMDVYSSRNYQPLGLIYKPDSNSGTTEKLEILIDLQHYYSISTSELEKVE